MVVATLCIFWCCSELYFSPFHLPSFGWVLRYQETLFVIYLPFPFSCFAQVMFYSLAVVTFGTAVPAGQFVPGIMIGSTYGRLVGMSVVKFYKKLNVDEGTWVITISSIQPMLHVLLILFIRLLSFALMAPWILFFLSALGILPLLISL